MIILVILSLSGIFIYQLFWITDLYHFRQRQNREEILMAVKNADHIELFDRADILGKHFQKQRETSAIADTEGGRAISTKFLNKDSIIHSRSILSLDSNIYHPEYSNEKIGKMLKSTAVEVGNDFNSLGELGLQMQRALHETIDTLMPIRIAKFDSILTAYLKKKGLEIQHFTEIRDLRDSSVTTSSIPANANLPQYDLTKWEYTTYNKKAYYVYTEPTHYATLQMMAGILTSSFLIFLILLLSFVYMLRFLIHQKTVEQLKDDFTHNVTHELKTPIAITYAAIEAMIHYNITDNKTKTDKYLHICQEELRRLSSMVEQILSLGLEHKKEFKLKFEHICLNDMLNKIIEQQNIKASKPFRTELIFTPATISLEADRTHLYNIISNLLDNAVKYSSDPPFIQIAAHTTDQSVIIRITDNGLGISKEHLPYIFDKFYRIPIEGRTPVKGYGIGLFYVKTMIQKHNGSIHVESIPDKGSSFIITLPQLSQKHGQ